jgi:hypothetical protein
MAVESDIRPKNLKSEARYPQQIRSNKLKIQIAFDAFLFSII